MKENILVISEITKCKKIENLFATKDRGDLESILAKYFGYKEQALNVIDYSIDTKDDRLDFIELLPYEVMEELDLSINGEGRYELCEISGITDYNGREVKSEHIILIGRLDILEINGHVSEPMQLFKLD